MIKSNQQPMLDFMCNECARQYIVHTYTTELLYVFILVFMLVSLFISRSVFFCLFERRRRRRRCLSN